MGIRVIPAAFFSESLESMANAIISRDPQAPKKCYLAAIYRGIGTVENAAKRAREWYK